MPLCEKLKRALAENDVPYQILTHTEVYSSQEIAATQHVPGREMVKVVIVEGGGKFHMLALPATHLVDLKALSGILGAPARLADEEEFAPLFHDCDTGAMPPFGNLYGIDVYVDENLTKEENIVFEAGTHYETVKMKYADFARLVSPIVVGFAVRSRR